MTVLDIAQIQIRRDTAANFTLANTLLAQGELGFETDTKMVKLGDGATAWVSLPYTLIGAVTSALLASVMTDKTGTGPLVFGNNAVLSLPVFNNFKAGCSITATAGTTTTLTASSNQQQVFTGIAVQTVALPDVTTLAIGEFYIVANNSTLAVTVQSFGGNTVTVMPSGTVAVFQVALITGTTAASWNATYDGFATLTGTGSVVLTNSPALFNPTLTSPTEFTNIVAAAPAATQNIDADTSLDWFFTTNAANNFILNLRASATVTLNTRMAIGQTKTFAIRVINAATNWYCTALQIDGGAVTPKWAGGSAPTTGDASARDIYTFAVTKTAASTYEVIASVQKAA